MCGIAGVLGGTATPQPMIRALSHRGPDGARLETVAGARLAHARLSIIDLECGWQPLHAAGCTVVGNGEIYNYLELTRDFALSDALATGSDFEPLLHLFAREGEAAFDRLRGMYALCLIGPDGRAWLARDPFGIKPLYILEHDGGLAFASEPRAFLAAGMLRPVLDEEAARELLALNYTVGERTLFQGLRRLAPGEIMEVRDGRIVSNRRIHPLIPAKAGTHAALPPPSASQSSLSLGPGLRRDERELLGQLDAVLEDSVRVHQRSDVPYGLFLSGGIDSAAIATLMARLNARPVTAFTCGFEAPGAADERAQAEKVARALGLDWRETPFGEADFWRILPEVAWALDDPTADYAALPTYRLAEAAKGTLTVVLTGEGGDELFGGYGRYRRALRPRWLGGPPSPGPTTQAPWPAGAPRPSRPPASPPFNRRNGPTSPPGCRTTCCSSWTAVSWRTVWRGARPSSTRRWPPSPGPCPTASRSAAATASGSCAVGWNAPARPPSRGRRSRASPSRWTPGSGRAPPISPSGSAASPPCAASSATRPRRACRRAASAGPCCSSPSGR
jgi:asparagine synthase (glutamine-hydrolysing)